MCATKYWISTSNTSFNTAANWSSGSAPANGDVLVFNHLGTANVSTNLGSTNTGLTIYKEKTYVGNIGVLSGATATYLAFVGGTVHLEQSTGAGSPTGSPLCMMDGGAVANTTFYIYSSSTVSSSVYYPPIMIKGGGGGQFITVHLKGGIVGIGVVPGEAPDAKVYVTKSGDSVTPELYFGLGGTLTDCTTNFGTIISHSAAAVPTLRIEGEGTFYQNGNGNLSNTQQLGGTLYWQGTGSIPIHALAEGATIIREASTDAVTIGNTSWTIYGGSILFNNGKASSITRSNVTLSGVSVQELNIELPTGEKF